MNQPKELCPTATKSRADLGALILDIRPKEEVAVFHFDVPNYKNIPVNELQNRLEELPKDERIVCVDNHPENAAIVAQFLLQNGFKKAYYMKRSVVKWVSKGFPVIGNLSGEIEEHSCGCSH